MKMTRDEVIANLEANVVDVLRVKCEEATGRPLVNSDIVEMKKNDPVLERYYQDILEACLEQIESDGTMEKMLDGTFELPSEVGKDVESNDKSGDVVDGSDSGGS